MKDLLLRFTIGGLVVSAFAALGAALKPKSFAGLFGAAPSVALAALGLTVAVRGRLYAAQEARSMIGGAGAFFLYAWCTSCVMMRYKPPTLFATVALIALWLTAAFGSWFLFLR